MPTKMKILITGTHFTPAQALIMQLPAQDVDIYYLGRKTSMEGDKTASVESRVLPKEGVHFIPIISGKMQGAPSVLSILSLFKIPIGFLQSMYWLSKIQPDVVVAFGGYTCVPVVISAWLLSIPVLIHQQTIVKNLSTQLVSLFAAKIALSFPKPGGFENKELVTGNPVRQELFDRIRAFKNPGIKDFLTLCKKNSGKLLLIIGGSQGSHIINQYIAKILPQLVEKYWIIHQCGDSKFHDFDQLLVEKSKHDLQNKYFPIKWIEAVDLGKIYQQADLALSRGGINTLLELTLFKVPALVVPLPSLYNDEQLVNAKYFARLGWVNILLQSELTSVKLLMEIEKMSQKSPQVKNSFQGPVFESVTSLSLSADKRLALEVILLARVGAHTFGF